ncbi:Hypothetical predicted protein [Paramuricea clavata]|uniref:Uncharacterized protein n=1 Tax=Paramuricea clavata TaxID=317549 RepID=A0A7D9D6V4_PARCT|nr:Hypothetical predicted protein [Paramuricea clavata]
MVSTCSQTDPVNMVMDKDENTNSDESGKASEGVSITQATLEVSRSTKNSDLEQSENESDGEESFDEESCTEDYSMTSGEESEMEGCPEKDKEQDEPIILTSEKSVKDQLKFIVCEESIATTFSVCLKCGSRCSVLVTSIIGSYCKILISCSSSVQHNISWSTGPLMNRLPAFNILMAASILSTGKSIEIASDMRVDSPGHCGLLGAGSTLDVNRNVILDTQIIKSTEVKNSNGMEMESLKRQLAHLEESNVEVKTLVTDRHTQVSAYMAQERPNIKHTYDVWHLAKGKKKRLLKIAKTKKFQAIKPWIGSIINHIYWVASSSKHEDEKEEKWLSLLNHIVNVHIHKDFELFRVCTHEVLDREWLKPGSAAYKKLEENLTRPRLITAIRKLSDYHQTSSLEAKHALDNQFATKKIYYPYHSLMARLFCSNMHFNENSQRKQAKTKEGEDRWVVIYPKAHKGEKSIARKIKEEATYRHGSTVLTVDIGCWR